jgi:hypothetical protein
LRRIVIERGPRLRPVLRGEGHAAPLPLAPEWFGGWSYCRASNPDFSANDIAAAEHALFEEQMHDL